MAPRTQNDSTATRQSFGLPHVLSFHLLTPANAPIVQTQLEARGKQVHWGRPYNSDPGAQRKLKKGTSGSGDANARYLALMPLVGEVEQTLMAPSGWWLSSITKFVQ